MKWNSLLLTCLPLGSHEGKVLFMKSLSRVWLCITHGLEPTRFLRPWDFQARILEWVAIAFSRRSSQPRDWTWVSRIVGRRFTIWATREVTPSMCHRAWQGMALMMHAENECRHEQGFELSSNMHSHPSLSLKVKESVSLSWSQDLSGKPKFTSALFYSGQRKKNVLQHWTLKLHGWNPPSPSAGASATSLIPIYAQTR